MPWFMSIRYSDALLAEAYAHARLFVYPSKSEGFGLPLLEAMTLGCPVLVCNTPALPEICGDAAHYFEPDSIKSLMAALQKWVNARDDCRTSDAFAELVKRYS